MKDFYNSYYKNYLKRIISTILTICLLVSNCLSVFAYKNNEGKYAEYKPGSSSGWSGNVTYTQGGGYRFTLLFLGAENSAMYDRVGNINIDQWEQNSSAIQVVGTLDVAYDGYDSQDYMYYNSNAFKNDMIGGNNRKRMNGGSRPLKYVSDLKKLAIESGYMTNSDTFNFSWQINEKKGKSSIGDVLSTTDPSGEKIHLDLYPGSATTFEMSKHIPTKECATIIKALCQANSTDAPVLCESVATEKELADNKENIFEQGLYKGKQGSYKLLIEPYEIAKIGNTNIVMTLRDAIWYFNQHTSGSKYGGDLANDIGGFLALMAEVNYMPYKDIFGLNSHLVYQNVSNVEDLKKLDSLNVGGISPNRAKMSKINNEITKGYAEKIKGYGISSFSSDMCKNKPHPMYIGQITHIFLPGTLNDTNEVKAYSMEYRGEKKTDLSYLDQTIMTLTKAIETATEPKGLTETKKAIASTNSLIDNNGEIDDSAYKALTDAITDQVEKAYIPEQYSSEVKALAKDIINDNTFKDFISQIYYQNIISIGYASANKSNLYDGPLKDWVRILVMQAMLKNETLDTNEQTKDTALAILPKDLENGTTYSNFGFKILNDKMNDELKGLVVKTDKFKSGDYKASYKAVASKDNTLYAENNISGDKELMDIFKDDLETTETQADGKTPKFIRVLDFVKY